VGAGAELFSFRQLIVELAEKSRMPPIYDYRKRVETGGLLAYEADFGEFMRRVADDVHGIRNGPNRATSRPIKRPNSNLVDLKATKALGLTLPPALLARADEVME
jgi:putative tryptophan/tyrosine transport system substrate-binding protein